MGEGNIRKGRERMKDLVLEDDRAKVVTADKLRAWIDHTHGGVRVFRLCGLNDPVELFARCFKDFYFLVDRFGNREDV